jgi:phosphonopyruvate decarboxylase
MLDCQEFHNALAAQRLTWFCGVPDSTLKHWLSYLEDHKGSGHTHRRAAIERDAIGYAAGYFLATGRPGVVYLQNSGLGNIVNPLTSLTDAEIYRIPVLLMIGWRGEPGLEDEPQHRTMGRITAPLLGVLGIRHAVLPAAIDEAAPLIAEAASYMTATGRAFALIICDGTFKPYEPAGPAEAEAACLSREAAIGLIAGRLWPGALIVATTGKTSRELFEYRAAAGSGHASDFLMVGAMGLASSLAAEVALQRPREKVFIFDGDAAAIMSAGNLATIGSCAPSNLYHIVFDNGCHDSTGGQPSTSRIVAWEKLALANAYTGAAVVATQEELESELEQCLSQPGPRMLVVRVRKGSRSDLGRPTAAPLENRDAFMRRMGAGR